MKLSGLLRPVQKLLSNSKKNRFQSFHRNDWLLVVGIVLLGLVLRLYPGKDHFLWIYDQARDSVVIESIIQDKNIVLIGPQTDYPGLNHGPISYYFLAPFYFISGGDPNLPGLEMIFLNLTTMIPLGLLVHRLFKDKRITLMTLFLFSISYEMVEYARWIFNFSVSIPFLVWGYYFIWIASEKIKKPNRVEQWSGLLAGVSLGFAIQGELFLLNHIPFFLALLLFKSKLQEEWNKFLPGLLLGLSPLVLAEIKFKFLGTKTFIGEFLGGHSQPLLASQTVLKYLDHLAVTFKHTVGGLSYMMGLWFLLALLSTVGWWLFRSRKGKLPFAERRTSVVAVLGLLVAHSTLFTFHFPDKVFVNTGLAIAFIVLTAFVVILVWELRQRLVSVCLVILIMFFSGYQLISNTINQTPLGLYNFIQTGMLYSQKMEMVEAFYAMAERAGADTSTQPFSLSVIGTPYGVRTVWATVFEQYSLRNGTPIPHWFGYKANGYPGEELFPTQDFPEEYHFLIIESNQDLLPPSIADGAIKDQDGATEVVDSTELYGYQLQLRRRYTTVAESLNL